MWSKKEKERKRECVATIHKPFLCCVCTKRVKSISKGFTKKKVYFTSARNRCIGVYVCVQFVDVLSLVLIVMLYLKVNIQLNNTQ